MTFGLAPSSAASTSSADLSAASANPMARLLEPAEWAEAGIPLLRNPREVVSGLMRQLDSADAELMSFYQDLYDHVLRASEWTESLRDMVSTIFETNLSLSDTRMNEIMKQLTSWAAIIAVPTAVTGFYGQNVPYPGFGHWWGFVISTVVIVVLAGGLYLGFRRRDWL